MKYDPSRNYASWYEATYPELTNFGIWLRGGEVNTLSDEEFARRNFRILFVRLSTYKDVAASFTHLLLYQVAKDLPGVGPDIAYLPPENDAKIFDRHNVPWLLGTNTKLSGKEFSVIAFSNSIVQELLNIPKFLKTSGIPLKRSERLEREDIPLIILGGANAPFTSSITGDDGLVDYVFAGHDVSSIKKLIKICADKKKSGRKKHEILKELESLDEFRKTTCTKIAPLSHSPVMYEDESAGKGHLTISEGCRGMCSFCAENWTRKPYKEIAAEVLVKEALKLKADTGINELELSSFNFNMHSEFYKILWELIPYFGSIGLKSQRFDMLSGDIKMIDCQVAAGKLSFSAGLEGVSPRLRRFLNKNLDEGALLKSIDLIFKVRARELKIFVVSTGSEMGDDFKEFDYLLSGIEQAKLSHRALTRVIFSITPLVKFPWTPLEFDRAAQQNAHDSIIKRMEHIVKTYGFEVREAMDTREYLISQILVRCSDEKVSNAIFDAVKATGFVYYRSIGGQFFSQFLENLKKEDIKVVDTLAGHTFEESAKKPWAAINTGIARKFLYDTYEKNMRFEEIGECLDRITPEKLLHTPNQYKERVREAELAEKDYSFLINIGPHGRGISRKYIAMALARAIMKADNSLVPYFRRYGPSLWGAESGRPTWVTGDDTIKLFWNNAAIPTLEKNMKSAAFLKLVNANFRNWGTLKGAAGASLKTSFALRIESPYRFDSSGYFKNRGLKYTLIKDSPKMHRLEFAKESVKKGIILACSYSAGEKLSLTLVPGPKFSIEEFVREAFQYTGKNDWVKINVESSLRAP